MQFPQGMTSLNVKKNKNIVRICFNVKRNIKTIDVTKVIIWFFTIDKLS